MTVNRVFSTVRLYESELWRWSCRHGVHPYRLTSRDGSSNVWRRSAAGN